MPEYTPRDMPEITVEYDYAPAEWERGFQVCPYDFEITELKINGGGISDLLEEHLIEKFGDTWEQEIVKNTRDKRRVA